MIPTLPTPNLTLGLGDTDNSITNVSPDFKLSNVVSPQNTFAFKGSASSGLGDLKGMIFYVVILCIIGAVIYFVFKR